MFSLQSADLIVWLRFGHQPSSTQPTQSKLAAVLIWPKHENTLERVCYLNHVAFITEHFWALTFQGISLKLLIRFSSVCRL